MGQANDTIQPSKPSFWRDPRFYQIASLSTLLFYGLLVLHFDISIWQIVITISTAQLMQYVDTRYFHLLFFDPKSALISSPRCAFSSAPMIVLLLHSPLLS